MPSAFCVVDWKLRKVPCMRRATSAGSSEKWYASAKRTPGMIGSRLIQLSDWIVEYIQAG